MSGASDAEVAVVWSNPPCRLVVRTKKQVEMYTVPERNGNINDQLRDEINRKHVLVKGTSNIVRLAYDAAFIMLNGVGVVKCNLSRGDETGTNTLCTPQQPQQQQDEPFLKDSESVQMMELSPLNTFIITWERYNAEKCPRNLKLWNSTSGSLVAAFSQKSISKTAFPYLHFTNDEKLAFLATTNEVRVYETSTAFRDGSSDDVRYADKLRLQGITALSVPTRASADNNSYYFTSFIPGNKDKPARASLHEYPKSKKSAAGGNALNYPSLISKSLFQAEEMKCHWNPNGNAALITLTTSVDTSGESYYGKSQLFLFSAIATAAANNNRDVLSVPLDAKTQANGPVLDVRWMPNPNVKPANTFAVTAGKMPAMSSMHNGITGEPTFLFGQQHRNTVAWSPHGRFLALAGFGNLAGGLSFWDKNKLKLIPHMISNVDGSLRAPMTTGHSWSPDSRLFVCSTTAPRMNVDNGIRLFRYTGEEISSQNLGWDPDQYKPDHLLEVAFVPAPPALPTTSSSSSSSTEMHYPDRPQTPPPPEAIQAATAAQSSANKPASASAAASSKTQSTASATSSGGGGRYVPPSERGGRGGGGSSLADRLRRAKEGSLQGATAVNKKKQPSLVKGATGRVIPGLVQTTSQTKTKSQLKREKAKLKKQQQQKEEEEAQASAPAPAEAEQQVDPEKRARKIKKTLKQIDDLKQKDPNGLNDDQKAKIASEDSLRSELEQLGL